LAQLNQVLGAENINITAQSLATEGELGYVVTDLSMMPSRETVKALHEIKGTVEVRII
jgi:D-3-phosphoglycerate dehydrogenase